MRCNYGHSSLKRNMPISERLENSLSSTINHPTKLRKKNFVNISYIERMWISGHRRPVELHCVVSSFTIKKASGRKWTKAKLIKPDREEGRLPIILSAEEVRKVLKCIHPFRHYAILATIYSCGLRISEAIQLQVNDVKTDRGFLHIRGKGSRDRYVPLAPRTLEILRMNWKRHRNPVWLFPAPNHSGREESTATKPIVHKTFRDVLKAAVYEAKVHPETRPHTFRHCYATHLLEQGVDNR